MRIKITARELVLSALFSALIAVGAFIKIPIGIVPITFQLFFVILSGLMLGSKIGFFSVVTYIFIGLLGIPVFSHGGGIGYVFEPTFGYIIGFSLAAFISGLIIERSIKKTFSVYLFAAIAGTISIYLVGVVYFYLISNMYLGQQIGIKTVLINCWLVFIPNDVLSLILAVFIAKRLKHVV